MAITSMDYDSLNTEGFSRDPLVSLGAQFSNDGRRIIIAMEKAYRAGNMEKVTEFAVQLENLNLDCILYDVGWVTAFY